MSGIEFFFEKIKTLEICGEALKEQIKFLLKNEGKKCGDIAVIFCNDDYLLKINEQYLGHDYYTDIVTFDYVENSVISGDLFISVDRVAENASQFNAVFNEELYRVVFHGILHLAGYGDKTDTDRKTMREKEDFYLKGIDFKKEDV